MISMKKNTLLLTGILALSLIAHGNPTNYSGYVDVGGFHVDELTATLDEVGNKVSEIVMG